jgi:Bifunctional DNA primase/polymerase, N-terminal
MLGLEMQRRSGLESAQDAAAAGMVVFPLRPLSQEPVDGNWSKRATSDRARLETLFAGREHINYAIATGKRSGVFAVELQDERAIEWWTERGFAEGARVIVPDSLDHEYRIYLTGGKQVENSDPWPGVRVLGQGSFIVGPGSMLATGTVKGTLVGIPMADFDPAVDLRQDSPQQPHAPVQIINALPILTKLGDSFSDLIFSPTPEDATLDELCAQHLSLVQECLDAGASMEQALVVASVGSAAVAIRSDPRGGPALLAEIEHAVELDTMAPSRTVALLSTQERATLAEVSWWGSRFQTWLEVAMPDMGKEYREAFAWMALSSAMAKEGNIPKGGAPQPVELSFALIGNPASLEGHTSHVRSAISLHDFPPPARFLDRKKISGAEHLVGWPDEGIAFATRMKPNDLPGLVWVSVHTVDRASARALEFQHAGHLRAESAPVAARLATELADAREQLQTALGSAPFSMLMDENALARHGVLHAALARCATRLSVDPRLAHSFADVVRKCATLVAMSAGSSVVTIAHELIAVEQAEKWFENLVWVATHADAGEGKSTKNVRN